MPVVNRRRDSRESLLPSGLIVSKGCGVDFPANFRRHQNIGD
jgi:hypothetical protein